MQEPSWPGCLQAWEQLGCSGAPGMGGVDLPWRPRASYMCRAAGLPGSQTTGAGGGAPRTGDEGAPTGSVLTPLSEAKLAMSVPLPVVSLTGFCPCL